MTAAANARPAAAETANGLQNDRLGGAIYPADTSSNSALQARRGPAATFAWRDYLEVHPAADDYPLLKDSDPAAFRELAEDIRKHGLRANIVLCGGLLLDGRNRLDALAELGVLYDFNGELGLKSWTGTKWADLSGCILSVAHCSMADGHDPYALAASLNVHRRHLTAEQKRDLIAKLLKAQPEKSNRAIAKQTKANDKTVAAVRRELQSTAEIPQLEKTVGADGKARRQPTRKVFTLPDGTKLVNAPRDQINSALQNWQSAATDPAESAERMKAAHADAEMPDDPSEDHEGALASPAEMEENALHLLARISEHARIFRKFFKDTSFDHEQKEKISAAIEGMIKKWRLAQATIRRDAEAVS